MAKIDVYKEWLKIEATNRPLTYYQLMRLKPFEDDAALIRKRYRDLNAYVRKFATGDFIDESQALLNELAKAMLCLTDAERKAEYDFRLGRKQEGGATTATGRRTLETILLEDGIATPDQIKKAKSFGDAVGIDLHEALLQQKVAEPERIMIAFAESIGVPFVDLNDVPVDEYYAPQINPVTARQHSFVPVASDMGRLILASPTPVGVDVEDELRMLFNMPVRCAICTPKQINAAIAKYYPRDAVQRIVPTGGDADDAEVAETPKKKKAPKAVKRRNDDEEEMSPAAKKNRLKLTLVCFNFGFMAGAFGVYFAMKHAPTPRIVIAGLLVGAIAGTIAWLKAPKEVDEDDE